MHISDRLATYGGAQDVRFRNLIKELEASLGQKYPTADARRLLESFEALANDAEFWSHTLDGLAVLGGPGIFHALRIPQSVPESVMVADAFHTKPLRRVLQSTDRHQVLGLSLGLPLVLAALPEHHHRFHRVREEGRIGVRDPRRADAIVHRASRDLPILSRHVPPENEAMHMPLFYPNAGSSARGAPCLATRC